MMTNHDLATLLARIQLIDNRTVDRAVLAHWGQILTAANPTLEEAMTAVVNHAAESTAYLMPAHIVDGVRRIRRDRASRLPLESPSAIAPRPENFDPMSWAWNNPVRFAAEVAVYNDQLATVGLPAVRWAA